MNKQTKKIYNYLISRYQADQNNLVFLAFGSASRGLEDGNSDIDFYIITKNKPIHYRENFIYQNKRIDVLFDSVNDIKKYLENEKNKLRRPVASMIYNSTTLLEKSTIINRLKAQALRVLTSKIKYNRREVLMHLYSLDDFFGEAKRDLEQNNNVAFMLDTQLIIDNCLELFCKIKNLTLTQPREVISKISKKDKKFAKLILNYSQTLKNQDKMKSLTKLLKYTYETAGGSLPDKWSA